MGNMAWEIFEPPSGKGEKLRSRPKTKSKKRRWIAIVPNGQVKDFLADIKLLQADRKRSGNDV